jgi:DNA-binding response OmpR family regulator
MPATRIIILEDDKELGEAFAEIFEIEGYAVTLLRDGQDILDQISTHQPELMILDLQLPHVSGLEVLSIIRQESAFEALKVVVVSADIRASKVSATLADRVLLKPVTVDRLLEVCVELVGPK